MEVVKIGKAKPDERLCRDLEDILNAAKAGRIRGAVIVAETADEKTATLVSGYYDRIRLVGSLHRLSHRIMMSMDEDMEPFNNLAPEEEMNE